VQNGRLGSTIRNLMTKTAFWMAKNGLLEGQKPGYGPRKRLGSTIRIFLVVSSLPIRSFYQRHSCFLAPNTQRMTH
jgi:hypothetical protein